MPKGCFSMVLAQAIEDKIMPDFKPIKQPRVSEAVFDQLKEGGKIRHLDGGGHAADLVVVARFLDHGHALFDEPAEAGALLADGIDG